MTGTRIPTATRTPAPAREPGAGAAERLLLDLRTEIVRADTKATVLVTALGTAAGVFTGFLAKRGWPPAAFSGPGSSTWWAGMLALLLAVLALLMAVLPRYDGSWTPGAPLTHFADVQRAARCGRLTQALIETERATSESILIALAATSRIALRKHQWIRTGLIAFATAVVLLPCSLLIG
ncbi:Pycsar system effector family protein [Streptomyces sp. NPDC018029]|uniref:Pycsar system effector family protein n=1 Tax=Streptomyces sp. NPDC018029 TaxID=3365032 RepID=UPI0037A641E7